MGRGSTFTFTAEFERAAGASARRSAHRTCCTAAVLVVDDHATNRFILTEQLAAWQMRAVAVSSAEAALATLREAARAGQPFEIALLDLVMPGLDGLGLARQITADRTLGQLSMLLLSSDQRSAPRPPARRGSTGPSASPSATPSSATPCSASSPRDSRRPGRPARGVPIPTSGSASWSSRTTTSTSFVATGILENLGCTTDVAQDGVEAVALLTQSHDYAAVLMDCRMPRLDGFDATRAVRAREPEEQRVPIIAMTASALEGERERCLAAGMDDFLTKPVAAADLEQVIRRWTAAPTVEPVPAPAAPASGCWTRPDGGCSRS